jgi:uncharacterized tellurite resistance protein B-like protein
MFAQMLLEDEKMDFLSLMINLSLIDKDITKEEKEYIKSLSQEVGVESLSFVSNRRYSKIEDILPNFKSNLSKHIVILELVNLAHADKDYSASERENIIKVAGILGISMKKLEEIENWVREGIDWRNRSKEILEG